MDDLIRKHRENLIQTFLRWRTPEVELPPNSVIEEALTAAIQDAKAQAYEEAARNAESHTANEYPDQRLPAEIAADIRALKDQLVPETTSV